MVELPSKSELLGDIKHRLQAAHGDRLRGVVLYGSVARGEQTALSDVDVLVLLQSPVHLGEDLQRNLDALYPLAMRLGRRISAKPVSADEYEHADCPLYRNVHHEGLVAWPSLCETNSLERNAACRARKH
jgi:uncharacterized protein